jgi:uncharacterized membrane protein
MMLYHHLVPTAPATLVITNLSLLLFQYLVHSEKREATRHRVFYNVIIIIIIIIIINIQGWAIWPVPSPELQLLSPSFLWSQNCSLSLWAVVV